MGLLKKATAALTRCNVCRGSGQEPFYMEGPHDVLDRNGRKVSDTRITTYRQCQGCGGSGKATW